MNTERLQNVLFELNQEVENQGLPALLAAFHSSFNQSITQPTPQTSEAFLNARNSLRSELKDSPSSLFPPSNKRVLTTIGGGPFFGEGLLSALTSIIDENIATPGQAVAGIQEHVTKANTFYAAVKSAHDALETLNITYDFTQAEEYEIGALLPSKIFDDNIDELGTELHVLDRHMRTFGELAGADTSSPKIRSISNGSLEIFLNALPNVAECIADTIQYVVVMYVSILQIREHRKGLKKEKVPEADLKPLIDHEKKRGGEEIDHIAEELFKNYRKENDANRDEELKGHLRKAVTYIAKRIDQGADFEVTPPSQLEDLAEDASEADKKKAKAKQAAVRQLLSKGQCINQLPERKEQVLSLSEPKKTEKDKN